MLYKTDRNSMFYKTDRNTMLYKTDRNSMFYKTDRNSMFNVFALFDKTGKWLSLINMTFD